MERALLASVFIAFMLVSALVGCTQLVQTDPQRFEVYTHCGLGRSLIEFDGSFWEALGPGPLSHGSGNPPPGFEDPFDRGTITRTDDDTAVYVSSAGVRLELARLAARPDLIPCR